MLPRKCHLRLVFGGYYSNKTQCSCVIKLDSAQTERERERERERAGLIR